MALGVSDVKVEDCKWWFGSPHEVHEEESLIGWRCDLFTILQIEAA